MHKHYPVTVTTEEEVRRNASAGSINWGFTTDDARIKLKRLYPSVEE